MSGTTFKIATDNARVSRFTPDQALCVGNPAFDQNLKLQPLPDAQREVSEISKFYKNTKLFTGLRATEFATRRELENASVVHLATHYLPSPQSFVTSRIILAKSGSIPSNSQDDGELQNGEIYKLGRLPQTRLVILSGCQTFLDRNLDGEGAIGAARTFLSIGVPQVIASVWPVDSHVSSELMIEFHRQYKVLGKNSVEALREAQLAILRSATATYKSPFYWAPFSVYGGYAEL